VITSFRATIHRIVSFSSPPLGDKLPSSPYLYTIEESNSDICEKLHQALWSRLNIGKNEILQVEVAHLLQARVHTRTFQQSRFAPLQRFVSHSEMNNECNSQWTSGVSTSADDFTFLEFDNIDIDLLPQFDGNASTTEPSHQEQGTALKGGYPNADYYSGTQSQQDASLYKNDTLNMLKGRMNGLQVQPGGGSSSHEHSYVSHYGQGKPPPTPNSIEMQGNRQQFNTVDAQQAIYKSHMQSQQEVS
jgi:hypothetical protein